MVDVFQEFNCSKIFLGILFFLVFFDSWDILSCCFFLIRTNEVAPPSHVDARRHATRGVISPQQRGSVLTTGLDVERG